MSFQIKILQFQTTCDFEVLNTRFTLDSDFGFYDIRQNFFVSKFGVIEGRGWNAKPQLNSTTSGNFLYIGLIERSELNEAKQLNETLNRLIEDGILLGKIMQDCSVTYHDNNNGFVDRNAWYGQPAADGLKKLTTSVTKVIAAYTADEDESCKTKVRF